MLSGPKHRRLRRAFAASLLLHVIVWPLLLFLVLGRARHAQTYGAPEEIVTITPKIAIVHPPMPRAHAPQTRRQLHPQPPAPAAAPVRAAAVTHSDKPQVRHHELARIDPRSSRSQPPATTALTPESIAQQQQQFARAIAQARAGNNPIAGSATGTGPASKSYTHDYTADASFSHGDGYLEPVKAWRDGPYDYYYLRYTVTYPDGGTESGIVPWPVRYLPPDDPFRRGITEHIPLLGPLPDYAPGSDVVMKPLVQYCYEHRFASCPIAHD